MRKEILVIILAVDSPGALCIESNDRDVNEVVEPMVMPVTIPYKACEQYDYVLRVELSSAVPYAKYELKPYDSPRRALMRVGTGLGGCGPNPW